DLAIFLLSFLDILLARRGFKVHAERERPARLSVGVDNDITILLENHGGRRQIILRDDPPQGFHADPPLLEVNLPAHGWVRLNYRLLPTERGRFFYGDIHVRSRGPLGLAWIDRVLPAREEVQDYPNLL